MGDLSLGNPAALLLLIAIVPLVAGGRHATGRRRSADAAYGALAAQRHAASRRRHSAQLALLVGAVILSTVAAAQPRWGSEERAVPRVGIDVVIALDISRSMTATDIEPSRAAAAADGLQRMLTHLRGDRVGLVVFAGSAFARAPLTLDLDALGQLVTRSQAEAALVEPGTNLGTALRAALALLDVDDPATTQVIVLISDGEDLGSELDAATAQAASQGIRVFTVAAGTDAGGTVPPREREDAAGTGGGELSRADRPTLRAIAETTGGNLRELEQTAGLAVEFQRLRQSQFDETARQLPIERFQWFLGGSLGLLGLHALLGSGLHGRRLLRRRIPRLARSALPAALFVAVIAACGGGANDGLRRGNRAYESAQYDVALAAYLEASERRPETSAAQYNAGNALHQLQRFEEATVATAAAASGSDSPELRRFATYALGNHAFRRGALEEARDAYIDVLLADPGDSDAKHNLELTLRLLLGWEPQAAPTTSDGADPGDGDAPTPTDGEGDDAGTDAPGDGSEQPADADGAGGDPNADGQPPDGGGDRSGDGAAETLPDAQAALSEALLVLGDELTLEQAIAILDLARRRSELSVLEAPPPLPGVPDR